MSALVYYRKTCSKSSRDRVKWMESFFISKRSEGERRERRETRARGFPFRSSDRMHPWGGVARESSFSFPPVSPLFLSLSQFSQGKI